MPATFAYWKLRGLGQAIRLLLEFTATEYDEKRYGQENEGNEWFCEKFDLGMQLPNLPYYFDGNLKITQSNAIMRHIARKNDLLGSTEEEQALQDMLENYVMDLRMKYMALMYGSKQDFDSGKDEYVNNAMKKMLQDFADILATKDWFLGNKITFVDFLIYEIIEVHRMFVPSCLDSFTNLKNFIKRFESLPAIKKYMSSPRFLKTPVNGDGAAWGEL